MIDRGGGEQHGRGREGQHARIKLCEEVREIKMAVRRMGETCSRKC